MTDWLEAETRMLRWSENSTSGRTITLELLFDDGPHPFRGFVVGSKNGQRFRMKFLAIGDDEEPIFRDRARSPAAPDSPHELLPSVPPEGSGDHAAAHAGVTPGARSLAAKARFMAQSPMEQGRDTAAMLTTDPRFQEWIAAPNAAVAKELIYLRCGISSLATIAIDKTAYSRFVTMKTEFDFATQRLPERRG